MIIHPTYWDSYLPILGSTRWTVLQQHLLIFQKHQVETLNTTNLKSIRAEGEVVSVDEDYTTSYLFLDLTSLYKAIQVLQQVVSKTNSLVMQKTLVVLSFTPMH